jgi:hypothetical protein
MVRLFHTAQFCQSKRSREPQRHPKSSAVSSLSAGGSGPPLLVHNLLVHNLLDRNLLDHKHGHARGEHRHRGNGHDGPSQA